MPAPAASPRSLFLVGAALAAFCGAGLVGALAGQVCHAGRLQTFGLAVLEFRSLRDAAACQEALPALQARWASVRKSPEARFAMASAYLHAARLLAHPGSCYEAALVEADEALRLAGPDANPAGMYESRSIKALALQELGRDAAALAEIRLQEKSLPGLPEALRPAAQVDGENALAYLLASARDPAVRNPAEALAVAKRMIAKPVPLADGRFPSQSAALLDTLAEAHHAAGQSERAAEIQRSALALADGQDLEVYLRHYDAYRAGAGKTVTRDE